MADPFKMEGSWDGEYLNFLSCFVYKYSTHRTDG